MEKAIQVRTAMIEKLKMRPAFSMRRVNRALTSLQLNLTRNSGYYALVSSVMCLCLVALKSDHAHHEEIDSELHYNFHAWDPAVGRAADPAAVHHPRERRHLEADVEPRIILFWTKYHGSATFDFGLGSRPFEVASCRFSNCKTTTDRQLLNESHAVIFHATDINATDMPPHRFEHQRWIYYTFTSPTNMAPLAKNLRDQFNWTMTYRRDSDIIHRHPYGALSARKTQRKSFGKSKPARNALSSRTSPKVVQKKRKLVAWITSSCPTAVRRENYVRELAKHIPVDIYGACGHLYCGSADQCAKMLRDDYKFVLAFENSLCTDYVTEKLYTALEHSVVPVVYGGADYPAYAPVNSYVDARDFRTAKHLADYLLMLADNDKLYANYLSWNEDYQVDRFPSDGWCHLCKLLHAPTIEHQSYSDISKWWAEEVTCSTTYAFTNSSSSSSSSSSSTSSSSSSSTSS